MLRELKMNFSCPELEKLWPEAVRSVLYVNNRTVMDFSRRNFNVRSPYEIFSGEKPDLSNLQVFGTDVLVFKPRSDRDNKGESVSWKGIHVGYESLHSYRLFIPELKRVVVSKDVAFIPKRINRYGGILLPINDSAAVAVMEDNILSASQVNECAQKEIITLLIKLMHKISKW